jgi:hypothetical protein
MVGGGLQGAAFRLGDDDVTSALPWISASIGGALSSLIGWGRWVEQGSLQYQTTRRQQTTWKCITEQSMAIGSFSHSSHAAFTKVSVKR